MTEKYRKIDDPIFMQALSLVIKYNAVQRGISLSELESPDIFSFLAKDSFHNAEVMVNLRGFLNPNNQVKEKMVEKMVQKFKEFQKPEVEDPITPENFEHYLREFFGVEKETAISNI